MIQTVDSYHSVFTPLEWQRAVWHDHSPVVLLTGSAGGGKALALDTPVLTMDGFKPMSDVEVGDTVFDMYGLPTQVVATTDVMYDRPCYILTLSSGEEIVCDAEHEWIVGISGKSGDDRLFVATTKWLADNDNRPAYIPLAGPVERMDSDLPVDPWLLGFLLGDGYMRAISFTTADEEIVGMVEVALPPEHGVSHYGGYQYGITTGDNRNNRQDAAAGRVYKNSGGKYTAMAGRVVSRGKDTQEKYVGSFDTIDDAWEAIYAHNGHREKRLAPLRGGLRYAIDELGLTECRSATKFVPDMYKYASRDQRLALLRGLMDADGYCQPERGRSEITVISRQLAEDIHEIACSLGIKSHLIFKWSSLNGVKYESWRVHFTSTVNPFSLERKARHIKPEVRKTQYRRYIESVEPVESVPVKCIQTEAGTYLITQSHIPTHNSRIMYEIGHAFCMRYGGANVLAVRKKLEDTKRSIIPTLDDVVIGITRNPSIKKMGGDRHYLYLENRSRLWWGGMYKEADRESIRSIGSGGSLDLVLVEEANQFTEEDYDELNGRLRGRAGPWTQIILATNPDGPAHWINRRLIIGGEASVHISNVDDNTYMDDAYRKRLKGMTGVTKARMALGLWVEGTGLVLDGWKNAYNLGSGMDGGGNVTLAADYMRDGGRIIMMADDGYTGEYDEKAKMFTQASHPRVFLLAQVRPTGQICVFGESYEVKMRYEAHLSKLKRMMAVNGWPMPSQVYYDKSSATLEGELRAAGFSDMFRSTSNRDESIKYLNERISPDENGFRSVLVHPRCRNLILEASSWPMVDGAPAKFFDHGCLVAGTMVTTDRGNVPIESIVPGDMVLTREGYYPVEVSAMMGHKPVMTVYVSDGRCLTGTPDHPVYLSDGTMVRIDSLRYQDRVAARSSLTSTPKHLHVPVSVAHISEAGTADVYNLAVGGGGPSEYYANGVLVSNCDALRYGVYGFYTGSGAASVGVPDSPAQAAIDAKMREIDIVMDRLDAQFSMIGM